MSLPLRNAKPSRLISSASPASSDVTFRPAAVASVGLMARTFVNTASGLGAASNPIVSSTPSVCAGSALSLRLESGLWDLVTILFGQRQKTPGPYSSIPRDNR
jgi:hypothetical protein